MCGFSNIELSLHHWNEHSVSIVYPLFSALGSSLWYYSFCIKILGEIWCGFAYLFFLFCDGGD